MNDEYILSHGGTQEDINQYAHDNGACNKCINYFMYCEYCNKSKEYYMKLNDLCRIKGYLEIVLKENNDLLIEYAGEIHAIFKVLPEDLINAKLVKFHKTRSIPLACEIADDLYKLYN